MGLFTQDELKPSEQTLNLIRQVAYTYRVVRMGAKKEMFCLNYCVANLSLLLYKNKDNTKIKEKQIIKNNEDFNIAVIAVGRFLEFREGCGND